MSEESGKMLTVPEMARDVGVSDEKVRTWCRRRLIEGVMNIGDAGRSFFRAPKDSWEKFKRERQGGWPGKPAPVHRLRTRPGRNLLGI